jgi:hypothetical protein
LIQIIVFRAFADHFMQMGNRSFLPDIPGRRESSALQASLQLIVLLVCLVAVQAQAGPADSGLAGWRVEQGVEVPSYAVTEPARTNLNIDSVVLACEEAADSKVLQLQLYLTNEGPLLPTGAAPDRLKEDPRAEILIDGRVFPTDILFAGEYVVLADGRQGAFPLLSDRLLDAMQAGRRMVLRFDLLAERPGQPAAFDGEAVIDLRSGAGSGAVTALRRCAGPTSDRSVGAALALN